MDGKGGEGWGGVAGGRGGASKRHLLPRIGWFCGGLGGTKCIFIVGC